MQKAKLKAWPNGAKVAVMVTVLYESWSGTEVPQHSPMVLASPMKAGTLDLQGMSWAAYGGETGIWRLLDIVNGHGIAVTACPSAQAVERFPESIATLHAAGHEIAAHAYVQDDVLPYLSLKEESDLIDRCTAIIAQAVGTPPKGWISPRATCTPHTARLLAERGYVWHGDYNDADLPYVIQAPQGNLVALMHSDFTDIRLVRGSPSDYFDVYRSTFDFLYHSPTPEIINLSVHAHFGGRPMVAALFDQILGYFRSFDAVWFARHDEIAQWVLNDSVAGRLASGDGRDGHSSWAEQHSAPSKYLNS